MFTGIANCDTMIAACRESGVVLEVIKTIRFRGVIVRAKRLIDKESLRQIRMIRGLSLAARGGAQLDRSEVHLRRHSLR